MMHRALMWASTSTVVRSAVERLRTTQRVVERFVAGEDEQAALAVVRRVRADGMTFTVDIVGEHVDDSEGARTTTAAYVSLLQRLSREGLTDDAEVSVKLSALGLGLQSGEEIALRYARDICIAADAVGAKVTLDMEGHRTVDAALGIGNILRQDFPLTGNVLQANLRRTEQDLKDLAQAHAAGAPARIRYVKGAYKELPHVAFRSKKNVDRAYQRGIDRLMAAPVLRPMLGTHDPAMLEYGVAAAEAAGRTTTDWEMQMLLGVRPDLQHQYAAADQTVRVYLPFGRDWYPYFMRRLAERPANLAFFLRSLRSSRSGTTRTSASLG